MQTFSCWQEFHSEDIANVKGGRFASVCHRCLQSGFNFIDNQKASIIADPSGRYFSDANPSPLIAASYTDIGPKGTLSEPRRLIGNSLGLIPGVLVNDVLSSFPLYGVVEGVTSYGHCITGSPSRTFGGYSLPLCVNGVDKNNKERRDGYSGCDPEHKPISPHVYMYVAVLVAAMAMLLGFFIALVHAASLIVEEHRIVAGIEWVAAVFCLLALLPIVHSVSDLLTFGKIFTEHLL